MKNEKGITLVALIITIIVMLILVTVSVTILIESNIIGNARTAVDETANKYNEEKNFGETGTVNTGTEEVDMNSYIEGLIENIQ